MQVIKGNIKFQNGLFCVHEMLEFKGDNSDIATNVAGYAIFDLDGHRISRICRYYSELAIEIEKVLEESFSMAA